MNREVVNLPKQQDETVPNWLAWLLCLASTVGALVIVILAMATAHR